MSPAVTSTRWCPTPEQLMILEEMYRSGGVRTPNATQIQQITSHLSNYGKIEGKNVFYWFQNHKARDRQKLRRKLLIKQQQQQSHHDQHGHHLLYYHASSPTPPQPYFSPVAPSPFFPQHQVGGLFQQEASSTNTMNYSSRKMADISPGIVFSEKPTTTMRMYGEDWSMMKMMMEVGPNNMISVPCQNRPLKTLELFPIKATNLKDECNNTSSSPYLIN